MNQELAVATGASSGIGYEAANLCAGEGLVADEPEIASAPAKLRSNGVDALTVEAELATLDGPGQHRRMAEPKFGKRL